MLVWRKSVYVHSYEIGGFTACFDAIENLLGYDAMFIGKLLALVTDLLEAPASSIFRAV